jgi:glutamyl-tRNA synthetase
MTVRTRFAPSPTGYLHIGGARTALFCWAYARHHGGKFILRIEDTDLERSTAESVQAILDGMRWLGLDWDEGPSFQMQRLARYREVAEALIAADHAYYDYMPKQELDALRANQTARGEKPRYDRAIGQRYRGEGPAPVRFKTPQEGEVGWNDLVKGPISFQNAEPTTWCCCAPTACRRTTSAWWSTTSTWTSRTSSAATTTSTTRRARSTSSTPRKTPPQFGHVPDDPRPDGERLSKRHGATSVIEYASLGYLPEALVNYLARLGWSHGDAEVFSRDELVQWFDLARVSRSAAQFNPEKLAWINQQYLKEASDARLALLVEPELRKRGAQPAGGPPLRESRGAAQGSRQHHPQLADEAMLFYAVDVDPE